MKRTVTHYFLGYTDSECWVPVYYITRDPSGKYYIGFEPIELTEDEVERRMSIGELAPLAIPSPIIEGQELWRTPYDDIWLATGTDPVNDAERLLLQEGTLPHDVSKKEILHRRSRGVRELIYIPDSFVRDEGSGSYHSFVDRVVEELARINGAHVVRQGGKVAEWEILATKLEAHAVDFCGLPYNLHPSRRRRFSVIQFASQPTYTCYYWMNSPRLRLSGHALFSTLRTPKERIEKALNDDPELQIGVFVDTTATQEVLSCFMSFRRLGEDGLEIKGTLEDLNSWIHQEPDSRVIICDFSIAEKLDLLQKNLTQIDRPSIRFEYGTARSTLEYSEPLPVGFVFPRPDERWGEDIRKAAAPAVAEILSDGHSYEQICTALRPLGVEMMRPDDLRKVFRISESEVKMRK